MYLQSKKQSSCKYQELDYGKVFCVEVIFRRQIPVVATSGVKLGTSIFVLVLLFLLLQLRRTTYYNIKVIINIILYTTYYLHQLDIE